MNNPTPDLNKFISEPEHGLLDLTVELSTNDVVAGNNFTLYLLIKNPFRRPIWIDDVDVMLPSELSKVLEEDKKNHKKDISSNESGEINIHGLVEKVTVSTNRKVNVTSVDGSRIGEVRYLNPISLEIAETGALKLKTSLPEGIPIQSGSTIIATAILNVKKYILFSPAKYRLQFTVNYSFEKPILDLNIEKIETFENKLKKSDCMKTDLYSNTISHPLSIRPAVYSMVIGSAVGGLIGALARILKISSANREPLNVQEIFTAIIVAMILSAVAIVFVARKSDNQSFVTVEDFWGGLLIGFFVGYTGTSFFENLTGINENGQIIQQRR